MRHSGNPILPGKGVCDPHIRVFDDRFYLYATCDASPDNDWFVMKNWWIWSSDDLVEWTHECTLDPKDTYMGEGFSKCWATDAIAANGNYYWYLSQGAKATGVVVSDTPTGPWRDPLGKALVSGDMVNGHCAHDPTILVDDDGSAYIAVGFKTYYIARLNPDMISLAEPPRPIDVVNPSSPLGPGTLDDKPTLHKRNGIYYLSWGSFYGMSQTIYGPYHCKGSFIREENVAPELRYGDKEIKAGGLSQYLKVCDDMGLASSYDRHGSFFQWKDQCYFICNDHSVSGSAFFRNSVLAYAHYLPNGEIAPISVELKGVSIDS